MSQPKKRVRIPVEQNICPVTGEIFETGHLLFDRDGRGKNLESKIITGYAFSPDVQDMVDKGNVVLVVIDPEKSIAANPSKPTEAEAMRTGDFLYLNREIANKLFGKEKFAEKPMAYIEQDTYDSLVKAEDKVHEEEEKSKPKFEL